MTKNNFITRLDSILMHNNIDRPDEREKSGLINTKRLGRYGTTDRLFRKRGEDKLEKNYSISLIMDASGSMTGSKATVAIQVVCDIAHCLEFVKGIEFEIVAFAGIDVVIKQYDQTFDRAKLGEIYNNVMNKMTLCTSFKATDAFDGVDGFKPEGYEYYEQRDSGGGTQDYLALYRAYKRICDREGRKILLTFSDGDPTEGAIEYLITDSKLGIKTLRGDKFIADVFRNSSNDKRLKIVTNLIKKNKEVSLIGVGIKCDAVRRFYSQWCVVNDTAELFKETLRILSKNFYKV